MPMLAQNDSTNIYKKLKTIKMYSVSLNYLKDEYGEQYTVNNKEVTKKIYEKYKDNFEDFENCCPCLLKYYNENDTLLNEMVSCSDCGVGYFKVYFSNGQVKLHGHYKENTKQNWDSFPCSVPDGEWIYYDKNGVKLYSEFWDNGNFIKQVPEQPDTEIWDVEVTYQGKKIDSTLLHPSELKDIIITPKFKNSNKSIANISIDFHVSAINRKFLSKHISLDSLKQFDLTYFLKENKYKSFDDISYQLIVLHNQTPVKQSSLLIKNDLPWSIDTVKTPEYTVDSIIPMYYFYLVNSMDTTKEVFLNDRNFYTINFNGVDSKTSYLKNSLHGNILELKKTSLLFSYSTEHIYSVAKDGYYSINKIHLPYNDYLKKSIPLNQLNHINYTSPSRLFFTNLGYTITAMSALTTLVVAPLVSINYRNFDFNKDRYYKVASGGLIGLTLGIPLSLINSSKTYKLNYSNNEKRSDYWYIKSELINY